MAIRDEIKQGLSALGDILEASAYSNRPPAGISLALTSVQTEERSVRDNWLYETWSLTSEHRSITLDKGMVDEVDKIREVVHSLSSPNYQLVPFTFSANLLYPDIGYSQGAIAEDIGYITAEFQTVRAVPMETKR